MRWFEWWKKKKIRRQEASQKNTVAKLWRSVSSFWSECCEEKNRRKRKKIK